MGVIGRTKGGGSMSVVSGTACGGGAAAAGENSGCGGGEYGAGGGEDGAGAGAAVELGGAGGAMPRCRGAGTTGVTALWMAAGDLPAAPLRYGTPPEGVSFGLAVG